MILRSRGPRLAAVLACAWLAPAVASAQNAGRGAAAPAPQPPPSNLQVMPKTSSRQEVLAAMQAFSQALGVQCSHCHERPQAPPPLAVGAAPPAGGGRGGRGAAPQVNFAADTNPRKQVARAMMTMTAETNSRLVTALGKPAAETVQVQCVTCHRGVAVPRQLADVLWDTMNNKGDSAAVEQYRALRQDYYGAQAYDFSERTLANLGQRSLAANKVDDAAAFLQLNLEFYPKSAQTYLLLSQVHTRRNDKDAALKDLETAVQLDPGNAQARRQLEEMKK